MIPGIAAAMAREENSASMNVASAAEHPSVLVVEDERKLAHALAEGLRDAGYRSRIAASGDEALALLASDRFDLVLLDLMLPGASGDEVLAHLRGSGRAVPVMAITARDDVDSRVGTLDRGADDYVVKPCALPEVLARARALLRRGRPSAAPALRFGDLELDPERRRVTRAGADIALTQREFELLEYLLAHAGKVVSREMLASEVWKIAARATPLDNVIDVTMARLRRKLDDGHEAKLLRTVRGLGYVLG